MNVPYSDTALAHRPLEVFYSYAHEDAHFRKRLDNQLIILQRQGFIIGWHDRDISAGEDWARVINAHLNSADIILPLVSPDFLASDYCFGVETQIALQRHNEGKCRVIPIILRPADWESTPLAGLQALPVNAKPVTMWRNRDAAFLDVVKGIRNIIVDFTK
jgi:hypothetical protein